MTQVKFGNERIVFTGSNNPGEDRDSLLAAKQVRGAACETSNVAEAKVKVDNLADWKAFAVFAGKHYKDVTNMYPQYPLRYAHTKNGCVEASRVYQDDHGYEFFVTVNDDRDFIDDFPEVVEAEPKKGGIILTPEQDARRKKLSLEIRGTPDTTFEELLGYGIGREARMAAIAAACSIGGMQCMQAFEMSPWYYRIDITTAILKGSESVSLP